MYSLLRLNLPGATLPAMRRNGLCLLTAALLCCSVVHAASDTVFYESIISADQVKSEPGFTVGSAGDVNGDGYADLLVNSPRYDVVTDSGTEDGRVYVYYGSSSGVHTDDASPYWYVDGDQAGAAFGEVAVGAGDFNNDGYGDIAISATGYDGTYANEGKVFVFYGGPDFVGGRGPGRTTANTTADMADWVVEGGQAGAMLGTALAVADVNGDSIHDIIIGASGYDTSNATVTDGGKVFVFYGAATTGLSAGATLADADWTAESNQASSDFGKSVAASNVDGDGGDMDDVIIGARLYDGADHTDEGAVFVFYSGSGSGPGSVAVVNETLADWQAEGNQDGANFGAHVASAGDVNGDTYGDLFVGAYLYSGPGGTSSGGAFVYHGSATGLSATADWSKTGPHDFAFLGSSAAAGDFNGDGVDDLLVGCEQCDDNIENPNLKSGGAAYRYSGVSGTGLAATPAWQGGLPSGYASSDKFDVALYTDIHARYGSWLGNAGDINGDSQDDYVITAYPVDELYLYLSGAAPSAIVTPTSGLVTSESGGTATFTIQLSTAPTADVTLALSSSDDNEGSVSPISVVFTSTDWGALRTFTVSGKDDVDVDGDIAYTIITGTLVSDDSNFDGITLSDIAVVNQDDEVVPSASFGGSGIQVAEGNSVTVVVTLSGAALTYPVTIPYTINTASSTATAADHDALSSGFITITAGTTGQFSFNTLVDTLSEGDEYIVFNLGTPTNATIGAQSSYTILLMNVVPPETQAKASGGGGGGAMGWMWLSLLLMFRRSVLSN